MNRYISEDEFDPYIRRGIIDFIADPTWGNEEGYCSSGDHYTTDINAKGECREHECEVTREREFDSPPAIAG